MVFVMIVGVVVIVMLVVSVIIGEVATGVVVGLLVVLNLSLATRQEMTARASVDALAKGDTVELRNFGVFEVRLTKARVGRNPNKPGSSFVIPPRATVKFKSGKIMRQKVEKLLGQLKRES